MFLPYSPMYDYWLYLCFSGRGMVVYSAAGLRNEPAFFIYLTEKDGAD